MASSIVLFEGLFFSALGLGYIVYGRKQLNAAAWLGGMGLCALPFFTTDSWTLLGIGLACAALPFVFRRD